MTYPNTLGSQQGLGSQQNNTGDFWKNMGAGKGFGSALGGLFGGLFGNYQDPGKEASQYYNQISPELEKYLSPYVNAGQQALPQLMQQYQQLMSDPTAMMSKIGAGYQASPGYKYNVGQATQAANNAAAAGGMLGSPAEQQELAQKVSGMADQDYQNYMNTALGQYGMGLQGMGGINQMGFQGSKDLSQELAEALMSQGNLAYSSAINNNQQQGGLWGSIGSLIGNL